IVRESRARTGARASPSSLRTMARRLSAIVMPAARMRSRSSSIVSSWGSAIARLLWSVAHHHAAVHDQGLPRHVVRVRPREERYHIGDVLGALGAAERDPPDATLPHLALPDSLESAPLAVDLFPHGRLHRARAHAVGGDALGGEGLGRRAREADHGGLGAGDGGILGLPARKAAMEAGWTSLPGRSDPGLAFWPPLPRAAACSTKNAARRFTFITRSHSSPVTSNMDCTRMTPALLKSTSSRPQRRYTSSSICSMSSLRVTSALTATWPSSPATFSTLAPSRSASTSRAPSAVRRRAAAAPMPLAAPVMSTVRPLRLGISSPRVQDV